MMNWVIVASCVAFLWQGPLVTTKRYPSQLRRMRFEKSRPDTKSLPAYSISSQNPYTELSALDDLIASVRQQMVSALTNQNRTEFDSFHQLIDQELRFLHKDLVLVLDSLELDSFAKTYKDCLDLSTSLLDMASEMLPRKNHKPALVAEVVAAAYISLLSKVRDCLFDLHDLITRRRCCSEPLFAEVVNRMLHSRMFSFPFPYFVAAANKITKLQAISLGIYLSALDYRDHGSSSKNACALKNFTLSRMGAQLSLFRVEEANFLRKAGTNGWVMLRDSKGRCLDLPVTEQGLRLVTCERSLPSRHWLLSTNGMLVSRLNGLCLDSMTLHIRSCHQEYSGGANPWSVKFLRTKTNSFLLVSAFMERHNITNSCLSADRSSESNRIEFAMYASLERPVSEAVWEFINVV